MFYKGRQTHIVTKSSVLDLFYVNEQHTVSKAVFLGCSRLSHQHNGLAVAIQFIIFSYVLTVF